tara:strand:+ start:1690 stop:2139 length:450 start_codon:yes stop_codon:yes gene_type:complete
MPHSNYEEISKAFIKHLYCKGKLSMKDMLVFFAKKGFKVNGSSSPEIDNQKHMQGWAHLSFGVEHILGFHLHYNQIEPVLDDPSHKIAWHMWNNDEMPEPDGAPIPSWIWDQCSRTNMFWEKAYEIPFRFAKGVRKNYPNLKHMGYYDW